MPAACSELCPQGCLHPGKSPELRLTVHSGGERSLGGQGIPDCGPQTLGVRVTQSCHPRPRHWPSDVCRALVLPGLCVTVALSLPQSSPSTAPEPWPPSTGPTEPGPLLQALPNSLSSALRKEMPGSEEPPPHPGQGRRFTLSPFPEFPKRPCSVPHSQQSATEWAHKKGQNISKCLQVRVLIPQRRPLPQVPDTRRRPRAAAMEPRPCGLPCACGWVCAPVDSMSRLLKVSPRKRSLKEPRNLPQVPGQGICLGQGHDAWFPSAFSVAGHLRAPPTPGAGAPPRSAHRPATCPLGDSMGDRRTDG